MPLDVQQVLAQIDQSISEYQQLRARSKWDDCSDQTEAEAMRVCSRMASTLARLSPPGSYHQRNLEKITSADSSYFKLGPLVGALAALRKEYELGHFQSFAELVHADTAVSFIDMAEELHRQGYKDAAAVITGSLLEQHLRDLCAKNQISVEVNGRHKKADALNAELAGQAVYSKLEQKNVTAWLGLRNEAAHGNYATYTAAEVQLLIQNIQAFMSRYPA